MSIDGLLEGNFHLDVWERHTEFVTVVAYEADLAAIERDGHAIVDKLYTVEDFVRKHAPFGGTK